MKICTSLEEAEIQTNKKQAQKEVKVNDKVATKKYRERERETSIQIL